MRTEAPSACTASIEQLFTACPSSCTVQAPQLPVSQPMCVPVRSRSSRRKWTSSLEAGTSRSYVVPLISIETVRLVVGVMDTIYPFARSAAFRTARTADTSARWRR